MPPLPDNFDAESTELIETLERRQKDLSSFQIPRLRECQGPLPTQQALAYELREDLDNFGKGIEVNDAMSTAVLVTEAIAVARVACPRAKGREEPRPNSRRCKLIQRNACKVRYTTVSRLLF